MDDSHDWSLEEIRGRIDRIDRELVRLLEDRARLALKACQAKRRLGLATLDPAREREVLRNVLHASSGIIPPDELRRVFEVIVACCRNLQNVAGNSTGRGNASEANHGDRDGKEGN